MTGDQGQDEFEVTPAMLDAGVSILQELAGEAAKATLAREVYLAMVRCSRPTVEPMPSKAVSSVLTSSKVLPLRGENPKYRLGVDGLPSTAPSFESARSRRRLSSVF